MSFSDLAAIGSFISGLAVVITLVFLLLQMRQSNANQKSLMQQGRTNRTVDLILRQTDPYLSETISRAFQSDLTMRPDQVHAYGCYAAAMIWSVEDSYLQYRNGTLDPKGWASDDATLRGFMPVPAFRVSWELNRRNLDGGFREYVDGVMKDVKPAKNWDEVAIWKILMAKHISAAA